MGSEVLCTARFGKQSCSGKALLETSELLFRGDFRLKIPFGQMKSVKAVNGELRIEFSDGKAAFELGAQAEKWAHKILHPKSRIEKLGIKSGTRVAVLGELDAEFQVELKQAGALVRKGKLSLDAELIFCRAESANELAHSARIAQELKGAVALWIVYPKGRKEVTENGVIACGRKAGLKDVKVVGFSPTHTALKFVVPLEKR